MGFSDVMGQFAHGVLHTYRNFFAALCGTLSPSPCGIPCAANAALNRPQPAADRPEMIIFRADTAPVR